MIDEKWAPCQICTKYEVSTHGHIRNVKTGTILKPFRQNRGYCQINLLDAGGKIHKPTVHRLVALAFLGPSDLEVNHKDLDKGNNRLDNLEYVTRKQNQCHASDNGAWKFDPAVPPPSAKLGIEQVREIRKLNAEGVGYGKLAIQFGVDKSNIAAIVKRRSWAHVDP